MTQIALFPAADERQLWDARLGDLLARAVGDIAAGSVIPTIDIARFRAELSDFTFAGPRAFEDVLGWTIAQLQTGLVQLNHPRYLGLFNPAPSFPAQCADRIAGAFNPQLATATTSPAAVEIEAHVARSVARRAGLSDAASGHFTSGGSEANATALTCALTRASPDFGKRGARAFSGQPVFYISRDSHLAWIKLAHMAGIGRDAARLVDTDGAGRMSARALRAAIAADQTQGCVPVMIVATAGTTNAGMIDPLDACADLAAEHHLWLHVDAAWGGGLIASERLRTRLAGIARAHSITIDAHKWFATTMGCGMFLTARPAVLSAAFDVATSYMPSHDAGRDPYVTTAQWSRRFLGLRLFLSLAAGGWAAHAAHVERAVDLVHLLAAKLRDHGWRIANAPELAVVCLLPPAGARPVSDIVARVLASGGGWVSAAKFEGQEVIRACVTHGQTSAADIVEVAELLNRASAA
jgi:glutamate/tyrosine decarboxylase-like PLP-dependent enzyme